MGGVSGHQNESQGGSNMETVPTEIDASTLKPANTAPADTLAQDTVTAVTDPTNPPGIDVRPNEAAEPQTEPTPTIESATEAAIGDIEPFPQRGTEEWKRAEAFCNAGIFGRSAKYFREVWDETSDPEAGWRYAHCLRKSGYIEVALGLLRDLSKEYPEHPQIREEFVWGLYEGRLVPAKKKESGEAMVEAARDMVAAEAEGKALQLAVFAVMNHAKTRGHWKLVSSWCDLLDPKTLDGTVRRGAQGSIPSDRERWYFGKLKALIQLQEWHLASEMAQEACEAFPTNDNFVRWKANAIAGQGHLETAIEILGTLRPKIAWYALADMARYAFELENVEEAWSLGQQAARGVGQDSAKVNLWDLMAQTALALGMPEVALAHIGFMEALRRENRWPLRASHNDVIRRICRENNCDRLPERAARDWKQQCREYWGIPKKSADPAAIIAPTGARQSGKIVSWMEERSFAFIQPNGGGDSIFVLASDLPESTRRNGARITFETIRQFNKRKNKDGLRAIHVQPSS